MYDKDGRMRQVRLNWEYKAAGLHVLSCECNNQSCREHY